MFLRVGSIQRSRQILDAFFFWMLPYLKGRDAILTDTWSIASIALNAARFLERYWVYDTISASDNRRPIDYRRCRVDMLSAYPDDLLILAPETRDVLRRVDEDGQRNVLVLLSAVATGNSLGRLREVVSQIQHSKNQFTFLALYSLDVTQDIPSLCDLSNGIGEMKFTSLTRDQVGDRVVIDIDRSTYFPLDIRETPLLVSDSHAAPAKEFFTQYRNSSVFTLHRNAVDLSNQELRHHGVYVDVEAMLSTVRFQERLQRELAALTDIPRLIITPPHRAGKILAETIASTIRKKWNASVDIFTHADLRGSRNRVFDELRSATSESSILIVDDVSVTGQRLSRYQQSLREIEYPGQIIYLLGVARPESDKNWNRRVNQLTFRAGHNEKHKVICVEKIILPDWDRHSCPWCVEVRALRQMVRRGELTVSTRAAVLDRFMLLERAQIQKGLVDNAIWRPHGTDPLHLTTNSIFIDTTMGPATEADVLASVAAAIQQMRVAPNEENRLEVTYPHVSVLDAGNYFGTRFNDDILRFAILRSAKAAELERWNDTEEEVRRQKLKEFLNAPENPGIFKLELAVARLARKVPQPEKEWISTEGWPADLWRAFYKIES